MTAAEQLARIAAVVPPNRVRIYQLDRGYSVWTWLCGRHLAKRKLEGWDVKVAKDPPHSLLCDDRALYPCGEEMVP